MFVCGICFGISPFDYLEILMTVDLEEEEKKGKHSTSIFLLPLHKHITRTEKNSKKDSNFFSFSC